MPQALDKADIYSYPPATEKEGKWFVQVHIKDKYKIQNKKQAKAYCFLKKSQIGPF